MKNLENKKMLHLEVHPKCLDSLYLTVERWWNINIHVTESTQLSVTKGIGIIFVGLLLTQGQLSAFLTS